MYMVHLYSKSIENFTICLYVVLSLYIKLYDGQEKGEFDVNLIWLRFFFIGLNKEIIVN